MASDLEKINKTLNQMLKILSSIENKQNKEILEIKKHIKLIEKDIKNISDKIQEFEIILDAAEIIEQETENGNEWDTYEDYEPEDYEENDPDDDF